MDGQTGGGGDPRLGDELAGVHTGQPSIYGMENPSTRERTLAWDPHTN